MKDVKVFPYVNAYGSNREFYVFLPPKENGIYFSEIWQSDNGELVSSGENTAEELNEFLESKGFDPEF